MAKEVKKEQAAKNAKQSKGEAKSKKGGEQVVHDQTAYGLIHIAGRSGQTDAEDLSALFPDEPASAEAELGTTGEEVCRLHAEKHPHPKRERQRETKGLQTHPLNEKVVQQQIDDNENQRCRQCPTALVFQQKESGKRIAEHERENADRLSHQIPVEQRTHRRIFRQKARQVE